ncbi:hypothetical protein DH2020_000266 [Rehmannia glutinosa]|uniref:Uncharacterized protein n=1 Tax=Rehmannia glutinosa TaxID=99300 RepID=A0ABR0XW01_REHGL
MTVLKRYVLRLFMSLKYITANVVDRNNGRIVATASTVEHSLKSTLECGRCCNAKAAAVVGEVLAMRLRVEGLEHGQGRGIHVDVNKEIEKKGFKNRTKLRRPAMDIGKEMSLSTPEVDKIISYAVFCSVEITRCNVALHCLSTIKASLQ